MLILIVSLLIMTVTVEGQAKWEGRANRHSPPGFSLLGVHNIDQTAGQSTAPPKRQHIHHHAIQTNNGAPEAGMTNQQAPPNNAAQSQKSMAANNAPQHSNNAPQHSNNAPQHSNNAPQHSNNAPQHSNNAPQHSNNAPQHSNNAPQHSNNAPQHSNNAPQHSNNAPHHSNNAPQHSNNAHHHSNNAPQQGQGSNPSYHLKHDAGWAAVHNAGPFHHHPENTIVNKNLKRVIPSDKNSVRIVDHIWSMFKINPAKPTQTAGVPNTKAFRSKLREAYAQPNQVQRIESTDYKQPPMTATNNHNGIHHQQHNNNNNNNQVYSNSPYTNLNNNQYNHDTNYNNQRSGHHGIDNPNKNIHNNNYNNVHNSTSKGGNRNVINPIKQVINKVLSPYDKIQSGLETIKTEVNAQQGMLGQLQQSMEKMKDIFYAIQVDMKNVLNSINSIMKMQ